MASIFKDAKTIFIAKIIVIFLNIGIQSCLAWSLGPEGRGSYAVCGIFISLMSIVFGFSVDAAVQYYVASKKMTFSEGVSAALAYSFVAGSIAVLAGYVMLRFNFSFFSKASHLSFYLAFVCIPISMMNNFFQFLFIGLRKFKILAIFSIILASLQLMTIFIVVFCLKAGVNGALGSTIFTGLLINTFGLLYFLKKYKLSLHFPTVTNMRLLFKYGVRFYFGRVSNIVNLQIGTIILAFFVAPAEIGLFSVGTKLVGYIMIIPDVLSDALLPRVASKADGCPTLIAKTMRLTLILCGLALGCLLLLCKPIVAIIFPLPFYPLFP